MIVASTDLSGIELLYQVADAIKTGWELCGSCWENCEAETIACQAIGSCRLNHKTHGDAFSWQGGGTCVSSGNGVVDNRKGMHSLEEDRCIVVEPYVGHLRAPKGTVRNDNGQPMVIRVTRRLLHYAAFMCDVHDAEERKR